MPLVDPHQREWEKTQMEEGARILAGRGQQVTKAPGWRRWCARLPNALASELPPRALSPPSPTPSPSFSVRLLGCLFSYLVHACSISSGLPAEIVSTAVTCSPTRHHHQTTTGSWRRPALLPYATAASQRQSRGACVTRHPLPSVLCGVAIIALQFACSGKAPVLRAVPLSMMSIALGKKSRQRS